jgi:hypothetical protein
VTCTSALYLYMYHMYRYTYIYIYKLEVGGDGGGDVQGMTNEGSKVPPLWPKGKGKTPRGAGL